MVISSSRQSADSAADRLLHALLKLLPQIDAILEDDWGADIHVRFRGYAAAVVSDLEHGAERLDGTVFASRLRALGTDLAMHRRIAHWDVGTDWNHSLGEAEEATK